MAELYDSAALALTELTSNVVRHTPDRRAAVLILRRPEERGLRVEVTDTSPPGKTVWFECDVKRPE